MDCPNCKSTRIQRDFDDAAFVVRLVGRHRLLCNGCGFVFVAFDPFARTKRVRTEEIRKPGENRRGPRFNVHIPAAISLIDDNGLTRYGNAALRNSVAIGANGNGGPRDDAVPGGEVATSIVSYSEPSRGHCEVIGKFGMGISLVGARFPERELSRKGRLLFIRLDLPMQPIEVVTSIMNHRWIGEERKRKWFLGVETRQICDADKEHLEAYLAQRASSKHVVWE